MEIWNFQNCGNLDFLEIKKFVTSEIMEIHNFKKYGFAENSEMITSGNQKYFIFVNHICSFISIITSVFFVS